MRFLTVAECDAFGPPGHRNEVTPVRVDPAGNVLTVAIYTQHASGWREDRSIPHGHRTYGRLVEAADAARPAQPVS